MVLLRAEGCVCPGPGFPVEKFIDSICFLEKFSSPCFVPRFRPKPLSAFDDLKKAITVHANVPIRVRMDRRFAFPHKGPILTLEMRGQPGAGQSGQAQSSIGCSAIDIVDNFFGHQMTIVRPPIPAIPSVA
jgi:hypothetical protein